MAILSIGADAKTVKGTKVGVLTGILYLAPADQSGVVNVCPWASPGCRQACLYSAGRGAFSNVQKARIAKTVRFAQDRDGFMRDLIADIKALDKKARHKGMVPAVRLNGTSDVSWESILFEGKNVMQHFPHIQFYDYTKNPSRMGRFLMGLLPANYHLTFSRSESNDQAVQVVLATGGNVAVVFRGGLPAEWSGRKVINGDETDVRFNDPKGVIVGLKAKGQARKSEDGFVVNMLNLRKLVADFQREEGAVPA